MRRIIGSVVVLILLINFYSQASASNVSGQTMGACPERVFLEKDQVFVAIAMSTLGDDINSHFRLLNGSRDTFTAMSNCAKSVRRNICRDQLLAGFFDPKDVAKYGIIGFGYDLYQGNSSLLGGLVASGAVGLVDGMMNVRSCNQNVEKFKPAAIKTFSNWSLDVSNMKDTNRKGRKEVIRRINEAEWLGNITSTEADWLKKYIISINNVLEK